MCTGCVRYNRAVSTAGEGREGNLPHHETAKLAVEFSLFSSMAIVHPNYKSYIQLLTERVKIAPDRCYGNGASSVDR